MKFDNSTVARERVFQIEDVCLMRGNACNLRATAKATLALGGNIPPVEQVTDTVPLRPELNTGISGALQHIQTVGQVIGVEVQRIYFNPNQTDIGLLPKNLASKVDPRFPPASQPGQVTFLVNSTTRSAHAVAIDFGREEILIFEKEGYVACATVQLQLRK